MTSKEYIKYIRNSASTLFSRKSIFGEFKIHNTEVESPVEDDIEVDNIVARDIASLSDIIAHNNESAEESYPYNTLTLTEDITLEQTATISLQGISHINGNGKSLHIVGSRTAPIFSDIEHHLEICDLRITSNEGCTITTDSHSGVITAHISANTALRNVTVENVTINSKEAAGALVGWISRKERETRDEKITILFENCHIKDCVVNSKEVCGHFVGAMCGYDYGESIIFERCSSQNTRLINDSSRYIDKNKSVWLNSVDFTPYNAWLGKQEYFRGNIVFDGNNLTLRWDGTTAITPLLAAPQYDGFNAFAGDDRWVVYTPFDLAGLRRITDSPAALYLKADIDMFGQGEDGIYRIPAEFESATESDDDNDFDPFFEIATLDGLKNEGGYHTIYNLSIYQPEQMHSAFIRHASGFTVHHHINFSNCRTATTHKVVERDAKSYGAILVGRIDSTIYTMDNVHAYDCKVYGLQKVGPLAARIAAKQSYIKNCTTTRCYVENYQCWITERFDSGYMNLGLFKARAYVDYYPHGEVGGMFGFVQNSSEISNCHVYGAIINAYGQDDVMATMLAPEWGRELIDKYGYYKVPGRHASTFIGDIRATGVINIKNCTADKEARCIRQYNCHSSRYPHIGQCYIVKFEDKEGSVTIDGEYVMIADCNKWTDIENDTMLK